MICDEWWCVDDNDNYDRCMSQYGTTKNYKCLFDNSC